jgi:hypothetical protein
MSVADSPTAPYEALADVIERELALVERRDFAGIAALKRERGAIVKRLPVRPPAEARRVLERCQILQDTILAEWQRQREELLAQLRQVRLAQRAAFGYSPARPRARRISASA